MKVSILKGLIVVCCILCLQFAWGAFSSFIPAWSANPDSLTELQQKQQRIEQYRNNVNQAKQRLAEQERSARDRLGGLKQQITLTAAQIETQQEKLKVATAKLQKIQAELKVAQENYAKQQTSAIARLRFLQRQPDAQGWIALAQSQTLEQLMDRQYQLRRVYQADQKSLVVLKQTKDTIEAKRLEVETQKNQIALLTQELMSQKASTEGQAQSEQILVSRLNSDREALTAAEQQLAAESEKIAQDIQQRLAARIAFPNAIFLPGTGQMLLPADGPITSNFGWRVHPILGSSRFHNGVDFGAEEGSLIRAADNGVVISAEWAGGYGNAVIIDHGNGLTTLYGHTSQMFVTAGQSIQKGQPIAAVGSTGLSTGPHLHFEVRRGGEPIDPMPFLSNYAASPTAPQAVNPVPPQVLNPAPLPQVYSPSAPN
ncbi:MAG TPA: peptidoglycan DD-metalloendopeptidase family protein [Stenomitos sp.]